MNITGGDEGGSQGAEDRDEISDEDDLSPNTDRDNELDIGDVTDDREDGGKDAKQIGGALGGAAMKPFDIKKNNLS